MKIKKLICKIFGHDYFFIKKLSKDSDMIGCERCHSKFGMHHELQVLLPYDKDMDDMYKIINPWHKPENK